MTLTKCAAFVAVLAGGWALGSAQVAGAPASERALSKKEITEIYEGKSWFWEKGRCVLCRQGPVQRLLPRRQRAQHRRR